MAHAPVISVIIPAHNRAHLLVRAIASVQRQTLKNFALIVVDDASDDGTGDLVATLADDRITYRRIERAGAATARNRGVAACTTSLVTFLDSDDEAEADWLASLVSAFQETSASIVCCGCSRVYDSAGRRTIRLPAPMGRAYSDITGLFLGGTFAIERAVFDRVGGYADELAAGHHHELALRLAPVICGEHRRITAIMRPLVIHHMHDGPKIRSDRAALLAGSSYVLARHSVALRRDRRLYSDYCGVAAVNAVRVGDFANARRFSVRACITRPESPTAWLRLLLMSVAPVARRVW